MGSDHSSNVDMGRILACAVGAVLAVGVSAAGDPAAKGFLPAWFKSAKGQFPGDKENYYTYSPAGMLMNFLRPVPTVPYSEWVPGYGARTHSKRASSCSPMLPTKTWRN